MAAHIWEDGDPDERASQRGAAAERARHRAPPAPRPFGAYVETVKIGNLLFLSGMLPVVGHEPQYVGRVGAALSAEDGRKAAEIACLNALSAAKAYLGSLDKITGVAKLGGYIATEGDFRDHPKVADGASELLVWSSAPGCSRAASSSGSPACPSACRSKSSSFLKSWPSVASSRQPASTLTSH